MTGLDIYITPTIVAVVWIVCYIVKLWISDRDRTIIPTLAAVLGLGLGLLTSGLSIESALSGLVSGLAATGVNELFAQYKKDTTIGGK